MGTTHLSGLAVAGVPTMGMSGIPATNGNVFFVNSVNGSDGNPGSADSPMATIAGAYAKCLADHGDIVVCTAGHAETVSAAGGITLATSGVVIWGLGEGADRPTLTFATSTAATVLITGANNQINNFVGICNIDQIVSPFVVQAADCTLNIEWHDGASNKEALRAILTSAAAARLNVNLTYIGFTGGSHGVNAIRLVGVANASITIDYYGICTTAVIEFVTTACTNVQVQGYFYVSGTTSLAKNVVDTVTGSTWAVTGFDGAAGLSFDGGSGKAVAGNDTSTVIADLAIPGTDAAGNALERDVIGSKADTGVTATGTTKSIAAYAKGLVTMNTVQSLDSTANAFAGDVIGNKTDTAVYVPGTTKSLAAYVKGAADIQEGIAVSATAIMANGNTIFTVAGGPIEILMLVSICQTANGVTASTLQYSSSGTLGTTTQTISGASASLSSATAGTTVVFQGTTLATAPLVSANAANIAASGGTGVIVPAGTLTVVIGVGSTTGTWSHFIRYRPLAKGVTVS